MFCRGLTPQVAITGAIMRTREWRTRKADHVFVSLDWEYSCLPTPPSGCMASASTGDERAPSNDGGGRTSDELVSRAPRVDMFHAFVEARWSDPMLGPTYRRKPAQPTGQRLLVAPYVDNGHGMEHHDAAQYAQQWAADERLAGAAYVEGASFLSDGPSLPPASDKRDGAIAASAASMSASGTATPATAPAAAPPTIDSSGGGRRNITFFFGGRTSRNIGPGKKGLGYYVRWALMRHWRRESSLAAQHAASEAGSTAAAAGLEASRGSGGDGGGSSETLAPRPTPLLEDVLIVDSDRSRDRLEVPLCNASAAPPTVASASKPCLAQCKGLPEKVRGACHGGYRSADVLRRARFALCLRGDIPSSPRPYDAVRYGAIPVFVSDHVWRVGLPFQCWVPWRLLSHAVPEAAFMRDPGAALRNITASSDAHAEGRMRALLGHFSRDLLWRHPRSRVAENILHAAANARRRAAAALGGEAGASASGDGGRRSRLPCCPLEDLDENNAEAATVAAEALERP